MNRIPFPDKKYSIILADPPWSYWNEGNIRAVATNHYDTMSQADIEKLPVKEIAEDNSILFLWTTFPNLQAGLDIMKAWGFVYKTIGFLWAKSNPKSNTPVFGVGWYTKSNAEICLLGTRGKAPRSSKSISSVVISPREEHSKKPDAVRNKIVEFVGDLPRIELFARQRTEGWSVWGLETDKESTKQKGFKFKWK